MKIAFTFLIILTSILATVAQPVPQAGIKPVATGVSAQAGQSISISKVYPNPVKDNVTIILQSDKSGDIEIGLINILGSQIKKWEPISGPAGERKVMLDLTEIKTGIYILKVTKSGQTVSQLLKKY